jgi:hypothetical protein
VTIRAHLTAVAALLAPLQAAPTNLLVFTGSVDGEGTPLVPIQPERTPYVVVRLGASPVTSGRLAPYSRELDARIYVACAGATWDEAAWAMEQIRVVLLDVVPVVSGRSLGPLRMVDSSPIEPDRDATPPVFVGVDLYGLLSV